MNLTNEVRTPITTYYKNHHMNLSIQFVLETITTSYFMLILMNSIKIVNVSVRMKFDQNKAIYSSVNFVQQINFCVLIFWGTVEGVC